jgi:hypothetical protein
MLVRNTTMEKKLLTSDLSFAIKLVLHLKVKNTQEIINNSLTLSKETTSQ